jgi:hypothetical protein
LLEEVKGKRMMKGCFSKKKKKEKKPIFTSCDMILDEHAKME